MEPLAVKPDRLAERIEEALTEPDPRRAVIILTELQLDTVNLAPDGPNIVRAREWLKDALDILRAAMKAPTRFELVYEALQASA